MNSPEECPLISIGIPTRSNPDGIDHTLYCLTNQTYRNLEIVISDNDSPDPRSWEVIEKYMKKDPRVIGYHQSKNIGMNSNYMFVFDHTHGRYFMWAVDDDHIEPTYVEELWNAMKQSNGSLTSVVCHVMATTAENKIIDQCEFLPDMIPEYHRYRLALFIAGHDTFAYYMRGLHKRGTLEKYLNGGLRNKSIVGRDNTVFMEMLLSDECHFGVIDKKLYMVHESRISNAVKYKDEYEGRMNRDVFGRLKFFIDLNSNLISSKNIPLRRKWIAPFVFMRMGIRTSRFYFIRYPYVLLLTLMGKRRLYQ